MLMLWYKTPKKKEQKLQQGRDLKWRFHLPPRPQIAMPDSKNSSNSSELAVILARVPFP
jgi:hypothetical protein